MLETNRRRIRQRLVREGWYLERHGASHDIYRHPQQRKARIVLPRHRTVSRGVARQIASVAGWEER